MTRLKKPQSKAPWLWLILLVLVVLAVVIGLQYFNVVQLGAAQSFIEFLRGLTSSR